MRRSEEPDASDQSHLVTRMEGARPPRPRDTGPSSGLPADLLRDAARRLRVVALIFAAGFIIAEFSVILFVPELRGQYDDFYGWGPGSISLMAAFVVMVVAGSRRLSLETIMNVGVAFEVFAAYGIAFAAYWGVYPDLGHAPAHLEILGLSFVAPWIMFYTIVIPNQPRKALWAAALAATSVPVALILTMRYGGTSIRLGAGGWINSVVMPYGIIVVTAYIGARVVFKLGTAVRQAREMGSYRLVERLGQGGMGEVWRARHRMLARPAAIKLIRADIVEAVGAREDEDRQQVLARFEREAQATALLQSPHTIELYDYGVTDDGTFYYVMELLDGFDLEILGERFGPQPPERVIHLLSQVCDSLAEAHAASLIHRDIKPANIYVCRYGRSIDFVKVLDFGLVKQQQEVIPEGLTTTGEGTVPGTPGYMSPEQAAGEQRVDSRADLYSLGCVAYWLLTGQMVFEAENAAGMMVRHVAAPPVPPSQRTELAIPPALDEVILACLEKDPERRLGTADELAERLAACPTPSPWTPERARQWWDLHRPPVTRMSETERKLVPA